SVPTAWQRPSPRGRDPPELLRLCRPHPASTREEGARDLYFCIRATTEENPC
ncbi:unnamed protein product, partial [Rangifer tarandus platyrhynchus]